MFVGAWLPDPVDLTSARVGVDVALMHSRFQRELRLDRARFDGELWLSGSTFVGRVQMSSLQVAHGLFMAGATFQEDVDLGGAKAGGQLVMNNSTFAGLVSMHGLEASHVFMIDTTFQKDVFLVAAKVTGLLAMNCSKVGDLLAPNCSTFAGTVNMESLQVTSHLVMVDATFQGDVVLTNANVGGQLRMDRSNVKGAVRMDRMRVANSLTVTGAVFAGGIDYIAGHVGIDFDLSGAQLADADLTGTRIDGELRLGSQDQPRPQWKPGAHLVLRNTAVGAIQDRPEDAWPDNVELDGFTYGRLGGLSRRGSANSMMTRDIKWYTSRWLRPGPQSDPNYSAQPYEQLAAVFRAAGEGTKATEVLYAGRQRDRAKAGGLRWLGLSLLNWTMGYGLGLRYFRALFWISGLVVLGAMVLRLSSQGHRHQMRWGFAYSLDLLIPVIQLRKCHHDIDLKGWARYYFYAHKMAGYVLASFLIAGIAGLTQK